MAISLGWKVVILSVALGAIAAVGATSGEEDGVRVSSGGRFLLQQSVIGGRHLLSNANLCGAGNAPNYSCPTTLPGTDVRCCDVPKLGKVCKDVDHDDSHCGACNKPCNFGWKCCGGVCVDIMTDPKNCSKCGKTCPTGKPCRGGMCGY